MKLTKKLVLAAAVIPLTLGTASAFAFGGKNKGTEGRCSADFNRGMLRQLELTDEQQQQMKQLRQSAKQEMKAGMNGERGDQMQSFRAEYDALLLADNFDEQAARDLASQMIEQQAERRVQMMEKQHQMLSLLTPEQKTKYQQLKQAKTQKCMEKRADRQNDNS